MGQETISVQFKAIGTPGVESYHGTLVLTNSDGVIVQYAGGTRSNQSMSSADVGSITNILQGEAAEATGGAVTSPYGALITYSGAVDGNMPGSTAGWINSSNPSTVLATGSDLSAQWATIVNAMLQINALNLPYAPATQNSNSAWCTAAVAAGLSVPLGTAGLTNGEWVPGCPNILPTTFTPTSDPAVGSQVLSSGTDSSGNPITTITDKNTAGTTVDSFTLTNSGSPSNYQELTSNPGGSGGTPAVLGEGQGINITQNDATISLANSSSATVNGNANNLTLGTGDNLTIGGSGETVNGSSDTITATSGTSLNNLIGSNDTVHLNGSADYLGVIGGSGDTVYATGDTIAATAGTILSNLVGSNDTVDLNGAGDYLGVIGGSGDTVNASGDTIATTAGTSLNNLVGSNDTVDLYGSGDYLGVIGGSGDTINASGDTIVATAGTSAANLNGNNDSVALGTDVGLTVFGVGNTVSGYSNDDIAFGYSASMTGTDIVNWADSNSVGADSWRAVFNPTSTEAVTISDWSGVNATGTLYDQVIDWTAGGSQLDWYNPEKDVSSVIGNFSGANETGDLTTETLNTTSGKSEDFDFDYNSNNQFIGYTEDYYSGSTLLGSADFNSYGQDVSQTGSVGSYGYYLGGYDLASSPTITASAPKGTHISEIASHDLNSGQFGAASAAETAFFQAQLTANSSSQSGVLAPSVHEAKWASGPITWSLATLAGSAASPFSSHMGEQYQAAVQAAFAQWGAATGLDFVEVAHIALGSTSTLTEGGPVELGPGMSVTAEIKTGKRRVISYFLSPIARHRRENLREKRNNISSILRISSSIESFLMRNHFKPLHIDKIFTINVIIIVINGVFLAGCTTRDKITVLNDKTGERATCYSGYYTIEEGLQQLEVMTQCLRACAQFGFQPTPLEKYSKYSPKEPDEKFLSQIPSQCKR